MIKIQQPRIFNPAAKKNFLFFFLIAPPSLLCKSFINVYILRKPQPTPSKEYIITGSRSGDS